MRKIIPWTLCALMAVFVLAPASADAQPGAGVRAIRGAKVLESVGRAARSGHAIRLDKAAVSRMGDLGRAAAASGAGRGMLAEQAIRNSPQGGMLNRHGIRPPSSSGRVPADDLGRYLNEGNVAALQQYLGSVNPNDLGRYLPYLYQNGAGYGANGYHDYWRDYQNDMSDAYRDATIANAIVNVVGILATTAAQDQQRVHYQQAPAPVVVPQQFAPVYENHKVLVQEGFYETEQVWVPERQDPATGAIIEAHQELHKRWVPPVFELRQVRVR